MPEPEWTTLPLLTRWVELLRNRGSLGDEIVKAIRSHKRHFRGVRDIPSDTITEVRIKLPADLVERGRSEILDSIESYLSKPLKIKHTWRFTEWLWK